MKFMILVKANKESEAGVMPKKELLAAMGNFNEELLRAGVLLAADGLQRSEKGARVRFSGSKRTVVDGPFTETKELVAGYWIWEVKSMEEAIEWVKRCPNPHEGDSEIEIRPMFDASDFDPEYTAGLVERRERLAAELAAAGRPVPEHLHKKN
ncbi:MAG: YciI family protein [Acidobacteriota bacterium]